MALVHTDFGPGEIIASETVRGRTQHKVAVHGVGEIWIDEAKLGSVTHQAWAPMDHDNSVDLPYDPTPQYPAIPGETESTIQPIHEIDADERLSPADSITFEDRETDEGGDGVEKFEDNFAKAASWSPEYDRMSPSEYHQHSAPYSGGGYQTYGLGPNDPEWEEFRQLDREQNPHLYDDEGYDGGTGGWQQQASRHEANPAALVVPVATGLARGIGMGVAGEMLSGGDEPSSDPSAPPQEGTADQVLDATAPGPGWEGIVRGASATDEFLASREVKADGVGAGLSDRYIDITASADYHNDPVAQFRHDPVAFIERTGHVHNEPVSPEMEHYGNLVEANPKIREAAWKDVRAKAMRLRREGRVHVKDLAPDRIYASVEGDHGTYEVMIAKGGAFGGFGGGQAIHNWRCACEWGKWAFQRRLTYVGRLCSHGYAAYMEMQSAHMKNQPRQRRLTQPPRRRKRADALQNTPQRLVPELVVNDADDARVFLDVTEDERTDTGPDDIVSERDIVHFARVMTACDRDGLPYPRELVAFLERLGEDQTEEDWHIGPTSEAGEALVELREWADHPQAEDFGHMEERVEDIRDAVDEAREHGVDASQLVANVHFRTAAPEDENRNVLNNPSWQQLMNPTGGGYTNLKENPFAGGGYDPSKAPGVRGGPNSTPVSNPLLNTPFGEMLTGGGAAGGKGGDDKGNTQNDSKGGGSMFGDAAALGGGNSGQSGSGGGGQSGSGSSSGGSGGGSKAGDPIGEGEYQIQPGDTLSDIAQRAGYGDDYQSLYDQNKDNSSAVGSSPDEIFAGGTLNIGKPGTGSSNDNGQAPQATDSPDTNAVGGPLNQNSGGQGADTPEATNPAQTGPDPATPATGVSTSTPQATTDAVNGNGPGTGSSTPTINSDTGATTDAVNNPATSTPQTDTSSANNGAGSADSGTTTASGAQNIGDTMGAVTDAISSGVGMASDIASGIGSLFTGGRQVFADQEDYNEWVRYAYPEAGDHLPFAGSGRLGPLQFSTSEEYADEARRNHDDVTDLEHHNVDLVGGERVRTSGIRPIGNRSRPVIVPEVIREQRPGHGRAVEAHVPDDFDPYSRTAAHFEDPYASDDEAGVHTAALGDDFVADFQRTAGAALMSSSSGSGGGDPDIAAAAQGFLRTAGRNYSLAEQNELIREGDIGGARNLNKLDLRGTHYEAEADFGLFT